ncbi:MAG: hypothetical protein HC769_10515 [Cyanobacteria bacterium CRU_2_1]|nr:hypothetical protein [Cyanobacteria bacterium RU_5_0]NJR59237.1 hypothetical protein [Cyanobacteria bacterium CRU_2_1]
MFTPTHVLVSRSRKTPVQLISSAAGCKILTEPEWQRGSEPAFEIRPRQGFFCQGIPVVGYRLQPIDIKATHPAAEGQGQSTTRA